MSDEHLLTKKGMERELAGLKSYPSDMLVRSLAARFVVAEHEDKHLYNATEARALLAHAIREVEHGS